MSLMLDPAMLARRQAAEADDYYQAGQAYWLLNKEAAAPVATPVLHGRLIVSKSGWALLTVPNALVRGLFDAMDEKGLELPPGHEGGPFTAHISVMTGSEIDKIGGPDKISERGHPFSYQLGPIMSVEPKGWSEMSRVWFVKVISPELKALRKSYGLDPLPNGDHEFHISVAVRRKNVLSQGPTSKAAADESDEHEEREPLKVRIPLVMHRVIMTSISFGKPKGDDGDDDDCLEELMDQIREKSHKASEKHAADEGLASILAGWQPPADNPYPGFEGFAPKFHFDTPGEHWTKLLGQGAVTAAPAAALAGGLALLHPWEQPVEPHKPHRQRKPATKTAAVSDVTNAIYSQLPRIRVPDTLVGAGVGGLGGLAYDALRGEKPNKDRWRKRLGRVLTGAGVGALGANVVGDRARRYISNSFIPVGYGNKPGEALKPRSLSHIWNAAVLDKPQYETTNPTGLSLLDLFGRDVGEEGGGKSRGYDYRKDTTENYLLPARREIFRRQLGVHTDDPAKDMFVAGPNDQLSINTKSPRAIAAAQRFMGDPAGGIPSELFGDRPEKMLDITNRGGEQYGAFNMLMGGQQIPYRKTPTGLDASILDRWDYTLDPKEDVFFKQNIKNMLDPAWRQQKFAPKEPLSGYFTEDKFKSNSDAWNALGGRWALDNVLSYRHPWITQRFRTEVDPNPDPSRAAHGLGPGNRIRLLTPEDVPMGDPITRASNQEFIKHPFTEKGGAAANGLAQVLAEWQPPADNPYPGFEGFAPKFHFNTPGEQWADALRNAAVTATPAAALAGGLALWRPWEQPAPPRKPERHQRQAVKAAAVSDATNAIYSQLPRIRVPDTLVGAGVGALGGLGYDAIQGDKPGESRWRKRLGRALTGAGVGALGANVVGDRARRYLTNSFLPFGYDTSPGKSLTPHSLSHVWNAAVLDKPQYEVASPHVLERMSRYGQTKGEPSGDAYNSRKDTMLNYVLPARREIFRRQMGVHTDDSAKDLWVAGPNDQLSINPKNPRAVAAAQRFMGDPARGIPSLTYDQPEAVLEGINKGQMKGPLFDAIVGGQQIPYKKTPTGVEGSVLDRWDYTLDPKENAFLKQNVGNMLASPSWRNQPFEPGVPLSEYFHGSGPDRESAFPSNSAAWQALAKRWGLDNLAAYQHPWITQRFRTEPKPAGPGSQLQMLTPEGESLGSPITRASNQEFLAKPFEEKEGAASRFGMAAVPRPMGTVAAQPVPGTVASPPPPLNKPKPILPIPMMRPPAVGAQMGLRGGWPQMPRSTGMPMTIPAPGLSMPKSMKLAADYAPGLPTKDNLGPFDRLRVGQMLDYVVQQHNAERAGPHHDIRFGDKDMGLLSWAARKGVPEPGVKHLAVQQPVHRHGYKDFEGEIPEGYGKGTVKTHDKGQVLITKVTPESVHFTTAHGRHPERFTLARPKGWDRNWLLMNTTPRDQVPYEKVRYKKIPAEQVEPHLKAMQEGDTAEAKVDGASQLVQLAKGHAEMLSFRTSKQTGRPIFHTERFFGGRPDIPVPRHLEGSILKGEIYAAHTGRPPANGTAPAAGKPRSKALPRNAGAVSSAPGGSRSSEGRAGTPQDVGTLLNSGIARSLQLQKERGLSLKNMLFDVQQYGRKPIDPSVTSRADRRKMLEEIAQHLPADKFHVSEEARDPESAVKLWNMIRSGQHPLTEEGVVFHPKVGVPSKGKLTEEHDVHLTGTFPGEGKRKATIGGFTYGHQPGKTVGKVGTGFSDAFLSEVARDPSAYTGRVARLRAQQKLPSGALRAPSFIGLHEDKDVVS